MSQEAFIIVDFQRDFCAGGALAVPEGDAILPVVQSWVDRFWSSPHRIITTQDAHPSDHISFIARGGPWPPHCIWGTPGALLHPALSLPDGHAQFLKGQDRDREAYSGFDGFTPGSHPVSLRDYLRSQGITRVYIAGLATDYCVRATALDALAFGFETAIIVNGVRGVDVVPGDSERALNELVQKGAQLI
ncbi:MAG: nicotinamidase [Firmicutes bacterium]|nr:nicotinamidase [Bacillota bacterium]